MNEKISAMLEKTVPMLVFALLSGLAYFEIIYTLLDGVFTEGNRLIIFFFSPVIVCGAAIVLIKLVKKQRETDNVFNIGALFWMHVLLILIAAAALAASIVG